MKPHEIGVPILIAISLLCLGAVLALRYLAPEPLPPPPVCDCTCLGDPGCTTHWFDEDVVCTFHPDGTTCCERVTP